MSKKSRKIKNDHKPKTSKMLYNSKFALCELYKNPKMS